MTRFAVSAGYMALLYTFIFMPVGVLVLFSFQDGRFPIPPLRGVTLRWYSEVLSDAHLMAALGNSLVVAVGSSLVALVLGFLSARGIAGSRLCAAAAVRGALMAPLSVSYPGLCTGLSRLTSERSLEGA